MQRDAGCPKHSGCMGSGCRIWALPEIKEPVAGKLAVLFLNIRIRERGVERVYYPVCIPCGIGISIGMAFAFSLVAGPILNNLIGVPGIFWLTALLALSAIAVLKWIVPNPVSSTFHRDAMTVPAQLKSVLRDTQLLRIDFGIFVLHLMLTSTFVVLPLAMRDFAHLPSVHHWYVYLPVMVVSMGLMVPFVIIAEKKRRMKQVFGAAVMTMGIAEVASYSPCSCSLLPSTCWKRPCLR